MHADETSSDKTSVESPLGKRRAAREMALQMLYQLEVGDSPPRTVVDEFDLRSFASDHAPGTDLQKLREAFGYAKKLVDGSVTDQQRIDSLLEEQTENWRVERMPIVDRNVLRIAVYELLEQRDVPPLAVVDEAIELAKKYGSEKSGRFVNGLLDGLLKREIQ
ncbi:MAG: transcription antitermination factor NusB [Acidobacteriota bacterium]